MRLPVPLRRFTTALCTVALVVLAGAHRAEAEVADLANVPLANSPSDAVLPNLMYVLDDSGSMAWNYMPDNVFRTSGGDTLYNCKKCTSSSCIGPGGTSSSSGWQCGNDGERPGQLVPTDAPTDYGEAPFYAAAFNKIWYNPNITYAPAIDFEGTSLGNATPTAASSDYYLGGATRNLTNAFWEVLYCNTGSPSAADLTNTAKCRKNGQHNVTPFVGTTNYFLYWGDTGNNVGFPTKAYYNKVLIKTSSAHYYNIEPHEYCSDVNLVNCVLANAAGASPGSPNTIAAPVRWCKSATDARATTAISGNSGSPATPRCKKKYDSSTYKYVRYGRFKRVDIVPATATYPKGPSSVRTDCAAAGSCTYAEEIQNFANWYSYYRTRMALMKTATGRAFLAIDDRFKIGFITINPNNPVTDNKYQPILKFDGTQKQAWYTKVYQQDTNGSTPNRTALHRIGRHYMGLTDGINSGMISGASKPDPVEYSCQQNFALLTTDGYWNDSFSSIGNVDNVNSGYTTRAYGAYDGAISGASSTLADVAAYYYKTDLRTGGGALATNNVPTTDRDQNPAQHMVTFTLGLGLEGFMDYQSDYETAATGDFARIKAGVAGACSWTTGICNWPAPSSNQPSTLDDLWHAAVNGRGRYFSASDPNSLTQGLQQALASLNIQTAAAAASATSSPNITETDNYIYSSTFRTVKWDGEIVARRIDTTSGAVLPAIVWSAQTLLDGRTSAAADTRDVFTYDESAGGKRKAFLYANLTAAPSGSRVAETSYFDNRCSLDFSQCALLTAAQKTIADNGANLVNYLRGQRQHESYTAPETNSPFRAREHILGDPVNATPAYLDAPQYFFADAVTPSYQDFQAANSSPTRATLFIASNDGMLHALDGNTGQERWAYVPRITMNRLHGLASENWSVQHEYNVDGSPQLMDVYYRRRLEVGAGGRPERRRARLLRPGRDQSGQPDGAVGDLLRQHGLLDRRPGHRLHLRQPRDHEAGQRRQVGGAVHLRHQQRLAGRRQGLSLRRRPGDGRDSAEGRHRRGHHGDSFRVHPDQRLRRQLRLRQHREVHLRRRPAGQRLEVRHADRPAHQVPARQPQGCGRQAAVDHDAAGTRGDRDLPRRVRGHGPLPGHGRPGRPRLARAAQRSGPTTRRIYAIKDSGATFANFRTDANTVPNSIIIKDEVTRSTTDACVDWATQDGWYVDLNPSNESPGERINLDPQLVQGTLLVVSNVPNNNTCTVGGDSWIYQFNYKCGKFLESAPLETAGQRYVGQITVGLVVVRLPSGVFKGIATGATGAMSTFAVNIGGAAGTARRISWRELFQR